MDVADFIAPSFTDNFGVKSISVSDVFRSTDIVTERKNVTYTAEDYDGNVAYASVVIEIIGRFIILSSKLIIISFGLLKPHE